MLSSKMMVGMIIVYSVIALAAAIEQNVGRFLYFIGAILLSVGVLLMG